LALSPATADLNSALSAEISSSISSILVILIFVVFIIYIGT
jgi:hypothetical protein